MKIKGIDKNHIREIDQDIKIKLAAMHGTDFNVVLMYTIVVSSLTSSIREIQFNDSIREVIARTKKKSANLSKKHIQDELEKLYMYNNENVSILFNLSYIDALAESFNYLKTARICKIQKSKYINRIVDLLVGSNNKITK